MNTATRIVTSVVRNSYIFKNTVYFLRNQNIKNCNEDVKLIVSKILDAKFFKTWKIQHMLDSCSPSLMSIPVSFLRYLEEELQGQPLKSVVLMTESQRHWDVNIEGGRYFKDGWQEFCLYNQLGIGDFLVFIHQSQLLFHVEVFDPTTACQRLYSPTFHRHRNCEGSEKRKVLKIKSTSKRKSLDFVVGLAAAAGETPSVVEYKYQTSRCHVTLTSHCFKMKFIYLPMRFSRSNGFVNINYDMTLVDVYDMSWKVRLTFNRNRRQCYIKRGWSYFQAANNLNPGDILSFQLLRTGKRPILKCYRIQKQNNSIIHEE